MESKKNLPYHKKTALFLVHHSFGSNIYPQKAMKWLFQYFFGTLQDPLLIVLMVLAIISIFLGLAFPEREEDRKYGFVFLLVFEVNWFARTDTHAPVGSKVLQSSLLFLSLLP